MVKDQRISIKQLFFLTVIYEIGSTTLFALGIDAKEDAWMAVLVALVGGLGLLWVYTEMQRHYPRQNLAEILISLLGKWLAAPLIILYALYWFYSASFQMYEFSEFMVQSFLTETPLLAIALLTLPLVVYSLFLGIEVIARSSEIIFPYFLFFIISAYVLLAMSGEMDLEQLEPVLGGGILPVLKAAQPVVSFPFSEMMIFMMYWPYVNDHQSIRKMSLWAVTLSGILLSFSLITMITVLGVKLTTDSTIPWFKMIKYINIGDFIQRLDAIGGAVLFIGGFYKMILNFNGSLLAVETLFSIKQKYRKWVILLVSVIWVWFVRWYFTDFTFYRWAGLEINTKYILTLYLVILPPLLLVIMKLKVKLAKKQQEGPVHAGS